MYIEEKTKLIHRFYNVINHTNLNFQISLTTQDDNVVLGIKEDAVFCQEWNRKEKIHISVK